jgi:hypothetical protein
LSFIRFTNLHIDDAFWARQTRRDINQSIEIRTGTAACRLHACAPPLPPVLALAHADSDAPKELAVKKGIGTDSLASILPQTP